jgi:hypothetical protein
MSEQGVVAGDGASNQDPEQVWAQVHEFHEHRALIEQAKGMLMFVYGIDSDAAFDVLRTQSQRHNVKLRLLAEQIVNDLLELSASRGPARRIAFDGLFLTAHRRIVHGAERQLDGANKTGE